MKKNHKQFMNECTKFQGKVLIICRVMCVLALFQHPIRDHVIRDHNFYWAVNYSNIIHIMIVTKEKVQQTFKKGNFIIIVTIM